MIGRLKGRGWGKDMFVFRILLKKGFFEGFFSIFDER